MLDDANVDAVIVSTFPPLHESIALEAMRAGKHVLCEKPLANSTEAARGMVARARESGVTLATGFNHRFFPAIRRVRAAIDSGEIGELDHVRAYTGHVGLPELPKPWQVDPAVMGGGTLMDNGIHLLDITRHLLGEIESVVGYATESVWEIEGVEDNGFALLKSTAGRVATLQSSWTEWRGYRFAIAAYGTRGMAGAFYAPMLSMVVTMDRPGGTSKRRFGLYPRVNLMEKLRSWRWTVIRTFVEEFRDFRGLIEGNPGTIADGFAGFRAVEIADAIYRSSAEGRRIELCEPF